MSLWVGVETAPQRMPALTAGVRSTRSSAAWASPRKRSSESSLLTFTRRAVKSTPKITSATAPTAQTVRTREPRRSIVQPASATPQNTMTTSEGTRR